jgi:hypothetical protein
MAPETSVTKIGAWECGKISGKGRFLSELGLLEIARKGIDEPDSAQPRPGLKVLAENNIQLVQFGEQQRSQRAGSPTECPRLPHGPEEFR